jgi:hypothetical protein
VPVAFADEQGHFSREFTAAWRARRDDPVRIASGIIETVRRMAGFEAAYASLRPILAMRRLRPSDPGPVLDMDSEELGALIDRRARFDPPRFPAPVGPDGYSMSLGPDRAWTDPLRLSLHVRAGQYREGAWDEMECEPHPASPLWQSVDKGLQIIDILVEVWGAETVSASAFIPNHGEKGRRRPWLTWIKAGVNTLPYPFPFPDAPPPGERRSHRDGELQVWP